MENEVIPSRKSGGQVEKSPQDKKYRVSRKAFIWMLIFAIILDLISLIPAINVITLGVGAVLFGIWWWKLGLGLINPKKVVTYGVTAIVEAIPIVSWLPGLTVGVIVIFIYSRIEDKTGIKLPSKFALKTQLPTKTLNEKRKAFAANRPHDSRKIIAKARRSQTERAARKKLIPKPTPPPINFPTPSYAKQTDKLDKAA